MKTVAFCGHGKLAGEPVNLIRQIVYSETEKLIRQGASEFLLGGYGDFDILCAEIIAELKKTYVNINSVLVIPYLNRKYDTSLYDCTDYPNIEKVPKSLAILKRNEYMVQNLM